MTFHIQPAALGIIKDSRKWHSFLLRSPRDRKRNFVKFTTIADLQRIEMGTAMCRFALTEMQLGLTGEWLQQIKTLLGLDDLFEYTITWWKDRKGPYYLFYKIDE